MKPKKVICLFGPTAVGKTQLIWDLHRTHQSIEIINADSLQVYKGLRIGTAKPEESMLKQIPHHLIDIRDPQDEYDLGSFCDEVEVLVREIHGRNKIPLISGGTAFYFKHLLWGKPKTPSVDRNIRDELRAELEEKGALDLYHQLNSVDPVSAQKISENDNYRILRALEVYRQTGKPLSDFSMDQDLRTDWVLRIIGLHLARPELYRRINERVESMFEKGLEQEMEELLRKGLNRNTPAFKAIGYKEFFLDLERSALISEIQKNTRRYAKRQLTFFRSLPGVRWFEPGQVKEIEEYTFS